MESFPLVSIITLVFNNSKYLADTVGSVLEQDYPNIELIIQDDASDDFSYSDEYLFSENIIAEQNASNIGTVANANKAIAKASGKYIKLLSCGDLFAKPDSLSRLVGAMEENRWQIANSISAVYDEDMTEIISYLPRKDSMRKWGEFATAKQYHVLTRRNVVGAVGIVFTRSLFDEIGGFDETYRLTEDWPTWLKLTRKGIKIEAIDDVSTKYRSGGVSQEGVKNDILLDDYLKLFEKEILKYRHLFSRRQWQDLQTQHYLTLHWGGSTKTKKMLFALRHIGYFIRNKARRCEY